MSIWLRTGREQREERKGRERKGESNGGNKVRERGRKKGSGREEGKELKER